MLSDLPAELLAAVKGFFVKYFIDPLVYGQNYNIVNTLGLGLLFVLFVWLFFKMFRRLNVKIDKYFLVGFLPYIILGAVMRVLRDKSVLQGQLWVTPGVWLITAAVLTAAFLLSLAVQKITERSRLRIDYYKTWFALGVGLDIFAMSYLKLQNTYGLLLIAAIFSAWVLVVFAAKQLIKPIGRLLTTENTALLLVHLFDATTTFVALQFFSGFQEEHVLAGFAMSAVGPVGMYLIKIPVVLAVLWMLDSSLKKEHELRNIIKMAILILGLGPGTRNMLTLIMGA